MREPEVVSPARIDRLLELACAYSIPLTIAAEDNEMTYRYKSRMFEIRKYDLSRRLVVDHPVTDGPAIALVPDVRLTVFFAINSERFFFESRVIRKNSFALANRRTVSAFEITYPNAIQSGQRRMFFRVPVPQEKPISVECGVIGDRSQWSAQEPGAWNFPTRVSFDGRIVNISVGGILLAVKKTKSGRLVIGTKLGVRFSLKPDESPLILKGVIRRLEERSPEEEGLGIEFIDTAEKFEYKLAVNRLYRYVAERQCEILAHGAPGSSGSRLVH